MKYTRLLTAVAVLVIAGCSGIRTSENAQQENTATFSSSTPVVVASTPAGNMATDKKIFIGFSRPMNAATINSNNIKVSNADVVVTYDAANRICYLKPTALLKANTEYLVTITRAVASADGIQVPVDHTFKVETRDTPNLSTPGVQVVGEGCIPTNGVIRVRFTEDMDATTINTSTFLVAGVTGTVTYDALTRIATFTPSADLTAGASYEVTITTGVTDLGGKSIGANFIFTVDVCTGPSDKGFCTYTKGGYAGNGFPAAIFAANYTSVFPNGLTVGIDDGNGPRHHIFFSSDANGMDAIRDFLTSPAGGASSALPTDMVNPHTTPSGNLPEQVVALTLNIEFSGTASMPAGFGDLKLKGTGTSLDGATVSTILAIANNALGGAGLPAGYTFSQLNDLITNLNESFDNCTESDWAKQHLE
jgi:hypothetical protein